MSSVHLHHYMDPLHGPQVSMTGHISVLMLLSLRDAKSIDPGRVPLPVTVGKRFWQGIVPTP